MTFRIKDVLAVNSSVIIGLLVLLTFQSISSSFIENEVYDFNKKLINSESDSIITDKYGNEIFIKNFSYNLKKKLISATDDVKIYDVEGNKYFVENVYIDLQNRRIVGDKVKVALDPKSFGLPDEENDPRFAANSILLTENVAELNKGVFTICKLRNEKCPPWSMQAKNIKHLLIITMQENLEEDQIILILIKRLFYQTGMILNG